MRGQQAINDSIRALVQREAEIAYTTMTASRVDPALLRPSEPPARCRKCGNVIDGAPVTLHGAVYHPEHVPTPQTAPPAGMFRRRVGRLSTRDSCRVLDWLAEHGPATARIIAHALDLDRREVTVTLRELDGQRVERLGVVVTNRRGRPPVVWRVRKTTGSDMECGR